MADAPARNSAPPPAEVLEAFAVMERFLRALIYRIVTEHLTNGHRANDWQAPYRRAVRTACDLAADTDKR